MRETIRARVRGGVLEPVEKIELPEGKEFRITISDIPSVADMEAFRLAAGGWKGTIDAEKLIRNIRADRRLSTRPKPRL